MSDWYTLSWNVTADIISFQAVVKAIGWIGFGIHEFGSGDLNMINADIYVGMLNSTVGFEINDRYAAVAGMPPTDLKQGCTDDILVWKIDILLTLIRLEADIFTKIDRLTPLS
jgi:hypothetical protein